MLYFARKIMYDELRYLRQLFWKILSTHPQNTRWTSDKLSGKYCYQIQYPRIHVYYCSIVYPLASQLVLQIYVKKVKLHPNCNKMGSVVVIWLKLKSLLGWGVYIIKTTHFQYAFHISNWTYSNLYTKTVLRFQSKSRVCPRGGQVTPVTVV